VFLQICWTGLLGTKRAYVYIEKAKLPEVLLSNINSAVTGKQWAARYSF
jgi:hypothetical protein